MKKYIYLLSLICATNIFAMECNQSIEEAIDDQLEKYDHIFNNDDNLDKVTIDMSKTVKTIFSIKIIEDEGKAQKIQLITENLDTTYSQVTFQIIDDQPSEKTTKKIDPNQDNVFKTLKLLNDNGKVLERWQLWGRLQDSTSDSTRKAVESYNSFSWINKEQGNKTMNEIRKLPKKKFQFLHHIIESLDILSDVSNLRQETFKKYTPCKDPSKKIYTLDKDENKQFDSLPANLKHPLLPFIKKYEPPRQQTNIDPYPPLSEEEQKKFEEAFQQMVRNITEEPKQTSKKDSCIVC